MSPRQQDGEELVLELPDGSGGTVFVFGYQIPYLPDLLASAPGALNAIGHPVLTADERQIAFLNALSANRRGRCALQLRFVSWPEEGRPIDIVVLGCGQELQTAMDLREAVYHTRPSEVAMEPLPPQIQHGGRLTLGEAIDPFDGHVLDGSRFAEIRRAHEPIDPTFGKDQQIGAYDLALLSWSWNPNTFTHSLSILQAQEAPCVLAVHVEPVQVREEVYSYLLRGVERFTALLREEWENPLIKVARNAYVERAQRLRQAALHTRVFVASSSPLLPGTAEYLGADLTRANETAASSPQAFSIVTPSTLEDRAAAGRMVRCLASPAWGFPRLLDEELKELTFLFDPREANVAFRIPVTPRGGLPGIATSRLSSLGAGALPQRGLGPRVSLGKAPGPATSEFSLTTDEVNQHVLVAGVPGSGKTTTIQSLLSRLNSEPHSLPFLVIDPAKSDYRSFVAGLENGLVVRLAAESVGWNPLAVPDETSVSAYIGRVQAAFDNAFDFSKSFPVGRMLLSRALREMYRSAGVPTRGRPHVSWPTLADLYRHVLAVARDSDYKGDSAGNVRAAFVSRIEHLVDGGLGSALLGDGQAGVDWADLAGRPALIELGEFPNPDDRALLFGLLLAGLVCYRESHPSKNGLTHVTVLEEAHRLLRASDDNYGTLAFAEAIGELRGAGEGFIVVDQAPSRLIPEVAKNTGTKISHRLLDFEERRYMGDAMVLSDLQQRDLARLPTGRAVVIGSSLPDAIVLDMSPDARSQQSGDVVPASALISHSSVVRPWCRHCPQPCDGSAGLREAPVLASILDVRRGLPNVRLFVQASRQHMEGRPEIEAFCGAARALSLAYADHPAVLPMLLREHAAAAQRIAHAAHPEGSSD